MSVIELLRLNYVIVVFFIRIYSSRFLFAMSNQDKIDLKIYNSWYPLSLNYNVYATREASWFFKMLYLKIKNLNNLDSTLQMSNRQRSFAVVLTYSLPKLN